MRRTGIVAAIAVLLIATSTLAACSAAAGTLVGPTWKLVAVGGQPAVADGSITFTADGQVSFQTGCNSGGGSYRVEAAGLSFGPLMTTEMACDEARNAQEAAFVRVLTANPTFVVSGSTLTLGPGADSLTFSAT